MPAITKCRFCKSIKLIPYLDLGFTPHSDHFPTQEELKESETSYPLVVVFCGKCGLSQLSYTVDPREMYQKDYLYQSSVTKTGVEHYNNFAQSVTKKLNLGKKDLVVDVGSNVGVLLQGFKTAGTKILGVDPAPNIARIANKRGIRTIPDFFTPKVAKDVVKKYGKAKVIVGTNVFAHVFNHHEFVKAVKILMQNNGVFIFESPHFSNLMENLEYDTVYHQHLLYLSLKPVIQFFKNYKMEVFDVETKKIHGGSFRVFIGKNSIHPINKTVRAMLKMELKDNIHSLPKLKIFAKLVANHRVELKNLLRDLKRKNKSIAIVSTPAKGMTLLNYCRIGPELIDFATEKSELKINRFTPGTHIPILPDSELLKRQPDYALLLAWNFAPEIMKNLSDYKKRGGKFIVPIPKPSII
ncbi:MAG: class I SAM-dependent methyltransferase [Patescibacteria group bacterium]